MPQAYPVAVLMASSLYEYIPLFEIAATFVVDPTLKGKEINPATLLKWVYRLFKHFLSVAGLLGNPLGYVNEIVNETDLDSAVKSGYYSIKSNVATTEGNKVIYGTMLVMTTNSYTSQIALGSDGLMAIRRRDVKTGVWDSWRSIGQ